MFKSRLLSSTAYFDAEKGAGGGTVDPKEAARIEREKINVTVTKKTDNEGSGNAEGDTEGEGKGEKGDDDSKDEGTEGGEDGDGDEGDEGAEGDGEKELTLEDYKKQLEAAKKKVARLEKRVGRTAGERDQIKKDLAAAQTALNAKVEEGQGLSEEEVERRAEAKATEKAAKREFDNAVKKLVKDATKVDKDFNTKVNEMAEDVAPIPPFMIGALEDLDNGGAVLAHLANNPDEYAEIFELSPAKMTSRLTKLSIKLEEEAKPKPKKISNAPDPLKPIKGGEKSPTNLPANPTKNMDEFVRMRAQQVAERKAARIR